METKDLISSKGELKDIDSIIFDLDGTFWDPTEMSLKAWQKVAREMDEIKKEITREELQSVFGVQHNLIAKKLFPDCPDETGEKFLTRCFEEEVKIVRESGAELYKDAEEVVKSFLRSILFL
jgi:phosphoglycolate phosphatase